MRFSHPGQACSAPCRTKTGRLTSSEVISSLEARLTLRCSSWESISARRVREKAKVSRPFGRQVHKVETCLGPGQQEECEQEMFRQGFAFTMQPVNHLAQGEEEAGFRRGFLRLPADDPFIAGQEEKEQTAGNGKPTPGGAGAAVSGL